MNLRGSNSLKELKSPKFKILLKRVINLFDEKLSEIKDDIKIPALTQRATEIYDSFLCEKLILEKRYFRVTAAPQTIKVNTAFRLPDWAIPQKEKNKPLFYRGSVQI